MSPYGPARPVPGRGFSAGASFRLVLAALIFLMLPAAADAYTLVLRSGRRVTVPEDFKVTQTAVTYEATPGFYVTVWLSNVDVAATEKANAEPAGSFAGRLKRQQEEAGRTLPRTEEAARAGSRAGRKTITNSELEPSRLRREAQEAKYERTRRERGMPSRQELQQRVEEQDRRLREWARQMEAERLEEEVKALRAELADVRQQLGGLSLNVPQRPEPYGFPYAVPGVYPYVYAPPTQFITGLPFGHFGRFGRGGFGLHLHAGRWPHSPRWGHPSVPAHRTLWRNTLAQPRALPPPARAPRRWR